MSWPPGVDCPLIRLTPFGTFPPRGKVEGDVYPVGAGVLDGPGTLRGRKHPRGVEDAAPYA